MPEVIAPARARIAAGIVALALAITGVVIPASAAQAAGSTLSGLVSYIGPGGPMPTFDATVQLRDSTGAVVMEDTTSFDGVYTFSSIAAGTYTVRVDMTNNLTFGQLSFAWLGDGAFFETAEMVTLDGTQTVTGKDVQLESGAIIQGTVTNGNGSALSDIVVTALLEHPDGSFEEVRSTTTNASGVYQLVALHSGDYTTLASQPIASPPYADIYWNAARTEAAATTVTVTDGGGESDINLVMPRTDGSDTLPTAPLILEGFPQDGETVSVDLIGWDPATVTLAKQWYLDGEPIFGATLDHYIVQRDQIGHELSVGVFATKSGFAPSSGMSASVLVKPMWADVSTNHFFNTELEWMRGTGISNGYIEAGYRNYHPNEDVSREAMAAFLYRLAGSPVFADPITPTFADVPTNHPFYTEIEWMSAQGITNGNPGPGGTLLYLPQDPVTRQAMAAFIYRFDGSPTYEAPMIPSFTDVPNVGLFHYEIEWLKSEGITTGYDNGDGTFSYHPLENVTRQSMAVFLYRYTH